MWPRARARTGGEGSRWPPVEDLGPSSSDAEYERTRSFYGARGFVALEEMIDFWDDEPMLLLVKAL